ncbi:MAG: alpha-2-macroglobulin [Chitinophagaceae bacterium]|nr:alpha-2-macroglobulin [Chitinophagaceae bacterium]
MVTAALPKFLRNGDNIQIPVTIKTNLAVDVSGQTTLQLTDAVKKTSVDGWFNNVFPVQYFTASSMAPGKLHFLLTVPDSFKTVALIHIISSSGLMSDSLQKTLPVIYNDHNKAISKELLDVKKTLFKRSGRFNIPLTGATDIFSGDTLLVKLTITSDKLYKDVSVTDPLAATMKVLRTSYKFTDTDISFSVPELKKGAYSFVYTVIAEHAGRFSFAPVIIKSGSFTASFDPGFILRVEQKEK